jgi:hypothetical protein
MTNEERLYECEMDCNALIAENAMLKGALTIIETWTLPSPSDGRSYGYHYGSNGERDYMREIARRALDAHRKARGDT